MSPFWYQYTVSHYYVPNLLCIVMNKIALLANHYWQYYFYRLGEVWIPSEYSSLQEQISIWFHVHHFTEILSASLSFLRCTVKNLSPLRKELVCLVHYCIPWTWNNAWCPVKISWINLFFFFFKKEGNILYTKNISCPSPAPTNTHTPVTGVFLLFPHWSQVMNPLLPCSLYVRNSLKFNVFISTAT